MLTKNNDELNRKAQIILLSTILKELSILFPKMIEFYREFDKPLIDILKSKEKNIKSLNQIEEKYNKKFVEIRYLESAIKLLSDKNENNLAMNSLNKTNFFDENHLPLGFEEKITAVEYYLIEKLNEYIIGFIVDLNHNIKPRNWTNLIKNYPEVGTYQKNEFLKDKFFASLDHFELSCIGVLFSTLRAINFLMIPNLRKNIENNTNLEEIINFELNNPDLIFSYIDVLESKIAKNISNFHYNYIEALKDYRNCLARKVYVEFESGDKYIIPFVNLTLKHNNENDKNSLRFLNTFFENTTKNKKLSLNTILHVLCKNQKITPETLNIVFDACLFGQDTLKKHYESNLWHFQDNIFFKLNNDKKDCLDLLCENNAISIELLDTFYEKIMPYKNLYHNLYQHRYFDRFKIFEDKSSIICNKAIEKPNQIETIVNILHYYIDLNKKSPLFQRDLEREEIDFNTMFSFQIKRCEEMAYKNAYLIFVFMNELSKKESDHTINGVNLEVINYIKSIFSSEDNRPQHDIEKHEKLAFFLMMNLFYFDLISIEEINDLLEFSSDKNLKHLSNMCHYLISGLKGNDLDSFKEDFYKSFSEKNTTSAYYLGSSDEKKAVNFLLILKHKNIKIPKPIKQKMIREAFSIVPLLPWIMYFMNNDANTILNNPKIQSDSNTKSSGPSNK